jgi:hypothetical protein
MAGTPNSSRLRVQVGTTDGLGDALGIVPGSVFQVGQAFSIGTEFFTVNAAGNPAPLLTTGASLVATFDTTTGAFNFVGAAPLAPIYFYPALPVMGLTNYELGPINNQASFAFDTQFAYKFLTVGWERSIIGVTPTWHGDDLDFFWSTNWSGITSDQVVLFVTNFQASLGLGLVTDDPIWAYSEEFTVPGWIPYSYSPDPVINPTNLQPYTVTQSTGVGGTIIASYIQSARIILPFKDRLIMLNTIENNANGAIAFNPAAPTTSGITPASYLTSTNTAYLNRCRYSHNGSPFTDNAWLEPNFTYQNGTNPPVVADGAGFIDAPTQEEIISAEFIKDRLIVYFERSTWELVYTGNQVIPFVWQKINTELGADATFSTVPFDKVVLGIGNVGVHACTGANVERIDNKIPDEVFKIKNKDEGVKRVAGIRDYYTEMVYWTFPSDTEQDDIERFPNRILVYNYKTGSWAFNNDCITTWGYFEQQQDVTWATAQGTWQQANFTWISGVVQAQFRQIIAGNQEGFVFIVLPDESRNAGVMQLTDALEPVVGTVTLTIIDHTLNNEDYIYIENAPSVPGINNKIFNVIVIDEDTIQLNEIISLGGVYDGGGTITRVSNIQLQSKQLNPYVSKGRNVYLAKVDFCVIRTSSGQITVDYSPSSSELGMIEAAQNTLSSLGNNILETFPYALYPLEQTQTRLWHTIYFQTDGEFIQFYFYLSDAQIRTPDIAFSGFELEGMLWHTMPTTARLQ